MKPIINIDDFGISHGVNYAVLSGFKGGFINSASMMITAQYVDEAIDIACKNNNLLVGLHFNITTGKSVLHNISIPLLTNNSGEFKNGFVKIFLLSIFRRKKLLNEINIELKAQLELMIKNGIIPSHIDSHRHIHTIPAVFGVVRKIADEYNVKRIRIINEKLPNITKIPPLGFVKWLVLRLFYLINREKSDIQFFSILNSCKMTQKIVDDIRSLGLNSYEIMLHSGSVEIDSMDENLKYERKQLLSKNRDIESEIR